MTKKSRAAHSIARFAPSDEADLTKKRTRVDHIEAGTIKAAAARISDMLRDEFGLFDYVHRTIFAHRILSLIAREKGHHAYASEILDAIEISDEQAERYFAHKKRIAWEKRVGR